MAEQLPVRKYIAVWIKNRKNPPRNDGTVRSAGPWNGWSSENADF